MASRHAFRTKVFDEASYSVVIEFAEVYVAEYADVESFDVYLSQNPEFSMGYDDFIMIKS